MISTDVYWLEQNEADLPAELHWLSETEALRSNSFRFPKRRADWRLGRWTAKRALAACLDLSSDLGSLAKIDIRSAPSGAPEVWILGQAAPVTISLSHRNGIAMCAVAPTGVRLGCDLETVEPRGDTFVADYFTIKEQAIVQKTAAEQRPLLVSLLWSGKESALKALQVGLRLDTNCVEVIPLHASPPTEQDPHGPRSALPLAEIHDSWHVLQVFFRGVPTFSGWWRCADQMVRTIVHAHRLDQAFQQTLRA